MKNKFLVLSITFLCNSSMNHKSKNDGGKEVRKVRKESSEGRKRGRGRDMEGGKKDKRKSWDVQRKTNWSQAGSVNARQCWGAPTQTCSFPRITSICFVSVLNGMLIVLN